jgi:hypothetical protein
MQFTSTAIFFVCYFILIVFYGESTAKECNKRSNCGCSIPTLQTLGKQEQATNNNPVKKHQKAQLQPQDPNPAKSNQTTINNTQRTNKQATTSPPGMTQFQSRLQNPKRANCNNTNNQTRTTTTGK